MPKIPGVNHQRAIRVVRQGKHVIMSDGIRVLVIPRANPIKAITMGVIVRDAGLTADELRKLL